MKFQAPRYGKYAKESINKNKYVQLISLKQSIPIGLQINLNSKSVFKNLKNCQKNRENKKIFSMDHKFSQKFKMLKHCQNYSLNKLQK
jgi:hypothetical protein